MHLCDAVYSELYMPAKRTQVYLSEEQRVLIDQRARRQGVTMAHVIREALDAFLSSQEEDDLDVTFGAAPELRQRVPSRSEWDSRG